MPPMMSMTDPHLGMVERLQAVPMTTSVTDGCGACRVLRGRKNNDVVDSRRRLLHA